jgi:hypothetical protein
MCVGLHVGMCAGGHVCACVWCTCVAISVWLQVCVHTCACGRVCAHARVSVETTLLKHSEPHDFAETLRRKEKDTEEH